MRIEAQPSSIDVTASRSGRTYRRRIIASFAVVLALGSTSACRGADGVSPTVSNPPGVGQQDTRDFGRRLAECVNKNTKPLPPTNGIPNPAPYPDPSVLAACKSELSK